jgi:hypothetical protein
MHMAAAVAAAWVAWAVWICNYRSNGSCDQERAGFGPLFFLVKLRLMSEPSKAVFPSYASQAAEAAQRICQALRAGSLEVWVDQSELRGDDPTCGYDYRLPDVYFVVNDRHAVGILGDLGRQRTRIAGSRGTGQPNDTLGVRLDLNVRGAGIILSGEAGLYLRRQSCFIGVRRQNHRQSRGAKGGPHETSRFATHFEYSNPVYKG